MPDLRDFELRRTPGEPIGEPPHPRSPGRWLAAGGLVVAAAIAAYIVFGGRRAPQPARTEQPPAAMSEGRVRPLGGDAEAIALPPLDETDPLVRELVNRITSHPRVAAWLTTEGLVRNFVLDVTMIADGKTPAAHLRVLRPAAGFRTVERDGASYIDPRSYDRYQGLADAVGSIDPAAAARLYATLKPRIEDAYKDLGMPDTPFDETLERALARLLETRIPDDPIAVQQAGATSYRFADPALEELTSAQKQLVRMGPRNARAVQSSLRNFAHALGIPAERLPR
jgi:hypothetical protein